MCSRQDAVRAGKELLGFDSKRNCLMFMIGYHFDAETIAKIDCIEITDILQVGQNAYTRNRCARETTGRQNQTKGREGPK